MSTNHYEFNGFDAFWSISNGFASEFMNIPTRPGLARKIDNYKPLLAILFLAPALKKCLALKTMLPAQRGFLKEIAS